MVDDDKIVSNKPNTVKKEASKAGASSNTAGQKIVVQTLEEKLRLRDELNRELSQIPDVSVQDIKNSVYYNYIDHYSEKWPPYMDMLNPKMWMWVTMCYDVNSRVRSVPYIPVPVNFIDTYGNISVKIRKLNVKGGVKFLGLMHKKVLMDLYVRSIPLPVPASVRVIDREETPTGDRSLEEHNFKIQEFNRRSGNMSDALYNFSTYDSLSNCASEKDMYENAEMPCEFTLLINKWIPNRMVNGTIIDTITIYRDVNGRPELHYLVDGREEPLLSADIVKIRREITRKRRALHPNMGKTYSSDGTLKLQLEPLEI